MNKIKETFRIPTSLNPLEWTHSGMSNIQTQFTFWNSIIAMKVFWVSKGWNELIVVWKFILAAGKIIRNNWDLLPLRVQLKNLQKFTVSRPWCSTLINTVSNLDSFFSKFVKFLKTRRQPTIDQHHWFICYQIFTESIEYSA